MEIPSDLAPSLMPLVWLLGRWEGAGVVGYPTIESANFGQVLDVTQDGRGFLRWDSRTWLLNDDGEQVRPLATESGFWRVPKGPDDLQVEFLLAHPTGYVEIYVGTIDGAKVQLTTDVVARTETAKEYSAATRIYGLVGGELLWAMDMAAVGEPMTSHTSAQLKRVG